MGRACKPAACKSRARSVHVPSREWHEIIMRSSSSVQGHLWIFSSRWFKKRSRHCRELRPGIWLAIRHQSIQSLPTCWICKVFAHPHSSVFSKPAASVKFQHTRATHHVLNQACKLFVVGFCPRDRSNLGTVRFQLACIRQGVTGVLLHSEEPNLALYSCSSKSCRSKLEALDIHIYGGLM